VRSDTLATLPAATESAINAIYDRLAVVWSHLADHDDIEGTTALVEVQPMIASLQAAVQGLLEIAQTFRAQRDTAVDEAVFWRKRGLETAHKQIERNIALQLDIPLPDAARVLDVLMGMSSALPSAYTMRELESLLVEIAQQTEEDEIQLSEEGEEEYFE
jgi:hypothetical protein